MAEIQVVDTSAFVNAVIAQVERVRTLHPQPSPYQTPPGYPQKNTVKALNIEPRCATIDSPFKVYPNSMGRTNCIQKKSTLKERKSRLSTNHGSEVSLRCTGSKKPDTDENHLGQRSLHLKKCDRKSRGGQSKQNMHSSPTDSDGRDFDDDYEENLDRKRFKLLAAVQKTADGYPDEISIPTEKTPLETCPSYYQFFRNNQVVVVVTGRRMANVTRGQASTAPEKSLTDQAVCGRR